MSSSCRDAAMISLVIASSPAMAVALAASNPETSGAAVGARSEPRGLPYTVTALWPWASTRAKSPSPGDSSTRRNCSLAPAHAAMPGTRSHPCTWGAPSRTRTHSARASWSPSDTARASPPSPGPAASSSPRGSAQLLTSGPPAGSVSTVSTGLARSARPASDWPAGGPLEGHSEKLASAASSTVSGAHQHAARGGAVPRAVASTVQAVPANSRATTSTDRDCNTRWTTTLTTPGDALQAAVIHRSAPSATASVPPSSGRGAGPWTVAATCREAESHTKDTTTRRPSAVLQATESRADPSWSAGSPMG
ncbi:unnamed protein product [Prorocentrum cordatum]|uniref:Uncharacterized protein n=1 Tax=Prorocentrum cordatum TaxID=2364126 RepID=A0ABN9WGL0_9DINO|nr:unnamed protein product [Polarella glacialis]